MNKKLKISTGLTVLVGILLYFIVNKDTKARISKDKIYVVLDSLTYNMVLPKNFRKTTELIYISNNKDLNFRGLDKLNISAS